MEADSESDRFSLLSGGEGPDLQLLASLDTQVMPKYILDHTPLFGPRKSTVYVGSSLLPDLLTLW